MSAGPGMALRAPRTAPAGSLPAKQARTGHNALHTTNEGSARPVSGANYDATSIAVHDNGRGIPTDPHPKERKPAVEVVMTKLHAGGKFDQQAYAVSGGLHGVGISVVNALSERAEVEVCREGGRHRIAFERGKVATPLERVGKSRQTGTTVRFWPDSEIFETTTFDAEAIVTRLRETCLLNPGLRIEFADLRDGRRERFEYRRGLADFVSQ